MAGVPRAHFSRCMPWDGPRVWLRHIPLEDRKHCCLAVVGALRDLSPEEGSVLTEMISAIRILLIDLAYDEPTLVLGMALEAALSGTWAGEELEAMKAHSAFILHSRLSYLEREKKEAKERVEQRRRRGIKSREATIQRRNERLALIERFRMAPENERARLLLTDWTISIDAYPILELPITGGIEQLSREELNKLQALIGTRGRGWQSLRRKLNRQIDGDQFG